VQIGSALGQVVVLAAYFWSGSGRPRASRSSGPAAVAAGAAAFALVWPITAGLSFATGLAASYLRGEPVAPIAHDTLLQMVDAPTDAWLFVMVGLLVAAVPVLEEIMYRGMLQRMLCALELSAWQAIALTSVIFAVMHVGAARWHALPALFVLSLGFGWAYERTGRLSAPIVMHMLFNAANLGLARLGTAAGG
jgi:membrane protease YdiL (CAAX protease family)